MLCYFVLVLAPIGVLVAGREQLGAGFWWDLSIILGFAGVGMLGIQFFLTARFRRLTAPFGTDIIYYFHRYLAIVAFLIVLLHVVIIGVENPAILGFGNNRAAPWYITAGKIALIVYLVQIAASLWRKFLRIEYYWWRLSHAAAAMIAYLLSIAHIEGAGYLIQTPPLRIFWLVFAFFWLSVVVYVRLIKPWEMTRQPYRVEYVSKERGKVWTITLAPIGHSGFRFLPGQFAWVTIGHSPFSMKDHPFSISSAPGDDGRLTFTIKALGDFTSTIGSIKKGERAFVDGPHGVFSIDRYPKAKGFIMVAGGVGIAPVLSMLEAMAKRDDKRTVFLFYGNRKWERVIFREKIATLEKRLQLKVIHVLREPPKGWKGERGFITADVLAAHLPKNLAGYEALVCGPPLMINMVETGLVSCGLPVRWIHSELFDLA